MSHSPQASEQEIVRAALRRVRDGDRDAFADVVEVHHRRIFGLMLMMIRDRASAEDVMQEAFIRAYLNLDRYHPDREFYPWLATIAVRLAQNWLKQHAARGTREEIDAQREAGGGSARDALSELIEDESARRLWRAVASLPRGERAAVFLHYREELRVGDVAAVLGVTSGTVKTMLFRARAKLRRLMADPPPPNWPEQEEQ